MAEVIFTKHITAGEVSRIVERVLDRPPLNVEVGGVQIRLQFEPPLELDERQDLDQMFSRLGYFMLEAEDIPE